jgi:3-oxoacyl-[acyl-carrier-protein] synthase III
MKAWAAMAHSDFSDIHLDGLAAALPETVEGMEAMAQRFGTEAANRIAEATGIRQRHIAAPGQCVSDLAFPAAQALLRDLGWQAESVDALIVVTQTPDYPLPATACLLHRRLGLSRDCAAFDIGLGCSGYVYGLWQAAALLTSLRGGARQERRCLLVTGDVCSRTFDPMDRAVAPLFGDAVAVTALSHRPPPPAYPTSGQLTVVLGSDGAGAPYLIREGGGLRRPDGPGLFMDGAQVFAFALREVPRSVASALAAAGWTADDVDDVVLHQANAMMLRRLVGKMGMQEDKAAIALEHRGNVSSASIPLAMIDALADRLCQGPRRLLLSGFGVGWSWATACWSTAPVRACRLILLPGLVP